MLFDKQRAAAFFRGAGANLAACKDAVHAWQADGSRQHVIDGLGKQRADHNSSVPLSSPYHWRWPLGQLPRMQGGFLTPAVPYQLVRPAPGRTWPLQRQNATLPKFAAAAAAADCTARCRSPSSKSAWSAAGSRHAATTAFSSITASVFSRSPYTARA
jgi:hypothetical protein